MKNLISKNFLIMLLVTVSLFGSSCATILGGRVSTAQRTKPVAGEPARKIRVVALIADFCFGIVPVVVDFATGAVYRPENK